ncbi:MAG: TetR family transcriptional regulator [Nocardioides sp.]|nr:TetR family transcriptional regulator [Nocardioides sp.]
MSAPRERAVQARTVDVRRRILDAAVEVLLEAGYAGASTVRIQERAGVSRGRLLHHFPSRDDLLVAAVHHLARARITALGDRTQWPEEPGERIDAAVEAVAVPFTLAFFWATTELWTAARTHAELRAALLPAEREIAQVIREIVDASFGPDLCAHPGYADLREVVFTSLRGMALTTAFDDRPEPTARHLERVRRVARAVLLG